MRPSALLSAFIGVSAYHIPLTPPTAQNLLSSRRCTTIHACDASDSGPDPEEWRAFRAKLISGGIKTTDDGTGETATPSEPAERQSVAPENEELLKSQNEALYKEYYGGAWAHESPGVEVGGLVCRLPLQAQLTRLMRSGEGRSVWGDRMREQLLADVPRLDSGNATSAEEETARLLAQWSGNTVYTYRLAERLISECLQSVSNQASDGKVDIRAVNDEEREMVRLYSAAQDAWQEVALVIDAGCDVDGEPLDGGASCVASEAVVINRPIARNMNRQLAQLILNGQEGEPKKYTPEVIDRFLEAFGTEAAVYVGGPEDQGKAGLAVHGFDLPGASELAPGTGLYIGGIEGIIDAVLTGERRPLDFRFFIGKRKSLSTAEGAWCPIACARPVALKQCLGLPKPLWHEVFELCGGEVAELSRIELLKRTDLQNDEGEKPMN